MPLSKPYEVDDDAKHSTDPDTGHLYADTGPLQGETAEERYGGVSGAGAFFGCLVAIAMAVLLAGIVGAGATAAGRILNVSESQAEQQAETFGLAGAVALLVIWMIAYYTGGYVAGRMSRFNGGRQGVAVWVLGLFVTILVAVLVVVLGDHFGIQYDVFQRALPSVPIPSSTLTVDALATLVAVVLGTCMSAVLGGKAGLRYQAKIDLAATGE